MKNKGFTLIELLIVIAIIGILSLVVLGFLGAAKSSGNDAAIISQMNSMRSQAEVYYNTTGQGSYSTVTAGPTLCFSPSLVNSVFGAASSNTGSVRNLVMAIYANQGGVTGSGMSCAVSPTAWMVIARLPSGGTNGNISWCVDSAGHGVATSGITASINGC